MGAIHETPDLQDPRPTDRNNVTYVSARGALVACFLTFVFLAMGFLLLGAFMLIALVILSMLDLVSLAQKVNAWKEVEEGRVREEKRRYEAVKQKPEPPSAA